MTHTHKLKHCKRFSTQTVFISCTQKITKWSFLFLYSQILLVITAAKEKEFYELIKWGTFLLAQLAASVMGCHTECCQCKSRHGKFKHAIHVVALPRCQSVANAKRSCLKNAKQTIVVAPFSLLLLPEHCLLQASLDARTNRRNKRKKKGKHSEQEPNEMWGSEAGAGAAGRLH